MPARLSSYLSLLLLAVVGCQSPKQQVMIESRFIEADTSSPLIASHWRDMTQSASGFVDDHQRALIIREVQVGRLPQLTAPRITLPAGAPGEITVGRQFAYQVDPQEGDAPDQQPDVDVVFTGLRMLTDATPQKDGSIQVTFDAALSKLEGMDHYLGASEQEMAAAKKIFTQRPNVAVTQIKTRANIPPGQTLLLGMPANKGNKPVLVLVTPILIGADGKVKQ